MFCAKPNRSDAVPKSPGWIFCSGMWGICASEAPEVKPERFRTVPTFPEPSVLPDCSLTPCCDNSPREMRYYFQYEAQDWIKATGRDLKNRTVLTGSVEIQGGVLKPPLHVSVPMSTYNPEKKATAPKMAFFRTNTEILLFHGVNLSTACWREEKIRAYVR